MLSTKLQLFLESIKLFENNTLTDSEINKIQNEMKVKFPLDFIEFIKKYNGGYFTPVREIKVPGNTLVLENIPSWKLNREYNILNDYSILKYRLPKKLIPIFSDPFGNCFCMDFNVNPNNPPIVFWDHEVDIETDQETITNISNSFASFRKLAKF
jgi:hypothetical protein